MQLDYKTERDVVMAFTTPIAQCRASDADAANQALRRAILAHREAAPDGEAAADTGWRSSDDPFVWAVSEMAPLAENLRGVMRELVALTAGVARFEGELEFTAWACVTGAGRKCALWRLADWPWAGYYIVDAGAGDDGETRVGGAIEFHDPRPAAHGVATPGNPFGRDRVLSVQTGSLVLFPAWLDHTIKPYTGDGFSVAIGFGARVSDFRRLD